MSNNTNKIVIALMDGRRMKGYSYGFDPARPLMVYPDSGKDRGFAQKIELSDCKAVYFVKSLLGNKYYRENKTEFRGLRPRGTPIEVEFCDGEIMVGTTEAYNPTRHGFFMYPPDPHSNNIRIYVVNANVREVLTGEDVGKRGDRKQGRVAMVDPNARSEVRAPSPAAGPTGPAAVIGARDAEALSVRDTSRFPVERRIEAVVRLLKGEDADVVSQEVLVPPGILVLWKERFLAAGTQELERQGPDPRDTLIAILKGRIAELEAQAEGSPGTSGP